jgi:4-amino-4-deoxy-L-arabinose transferase-like glycosyltransferase
MQLNTDARSTSTIRLHAVGLPRLTSERALLLALFGAIFLLRIIPIHYNTLFIDDAIYATLGHDILRHDFSQGASKWIFGSYLYPVLSALADTAAGEVGIRLLGAFLSVLSAAFVYLFSRRLFGSTAALWGLFFFGLTGCSIALGQQSVIDSLSVPFLALSVLCLVLAFEPGTNRKRMLFAAGLALSVSMLAKYINLLYLPALAGLFVAFNLREGRGLRDVFAGMEWVYFAVPLIVLFGGYVAIYYSDLIEVLTGDYSRQIVARSEVANTLVAELGVVLMVSLVGLLFVIRSVLRHGDGSIGRRVLLVGGVWLLFLSFLTLPFYHVLSANIRSISKHDVYVLVFLAPLAGYGVAASVEWLTNGLHLITPLRRGVQVVGMLATVVLALGFVGQSQQQVDDFHRSWPNAATTVDYLKTLNLGPNNTVLASASAVYEYYLDLGPASRSIWSNMWYLEYQGLTGRDALTTAVGVCTFDVVITDDFYSPEVNWYLEPLLAQTGYQLAYSTRESLRSGSPVSIRVYVPSNAGECAVRFNTSPSSS